MKKIFLTILLLLLFQTNASAFTFKQPSADLKSVTQGIRGINLSENDSIVSLSIINHDSEKKLHKSNKDANSELKAKQKYILSITENGYGKRTSHYDF